MANKAAIGKWTRRGLGIAALGGLAASLVYAWIPKPVPADFAQAERGTMRVTVDEDGRTRVTDRHVISAPLRGNLARIELDPGDPVEQGDVLARIVPLEPPLLDQRSQAQAEAQVAAARAALQQAKASVERAQAALEYARTEAERRRKLYPKGAVAKASLERAELELQTRKEELTSARFGKRVAEYEVRMAKAALGRVAGGEQEQLEIPSPIDGRVLRVMRESAGAVEAATPLLEVGDPSALEIVVDVLTSDAVEIQPGDPVTIERWGGEQPLQAHVRNVEPSAFQEISSLGVEEQRVNVILDLDSPREDWKELGDGYRVEAKIVVWEGDDVLRVPTGAVFRHDDGWAVYAVDGGAARLQPIEIGHRGGMQVEVNEGLEPGDPVIVHPSDQIADGVEVRPR